MLDTVNQNNFVISKEEIDVLSKGIFPTIYRGSNWDDTINMQENRNYGTPKFVIQRNLSDDSFNLILKNNRHIPFDISPRFQIEKKIMDINLGILYGNKESDILEQRLTHIELNDKGFSKIHSFAAGVDLHDELNLNETVAVQRGNDVFGFLVNIQGKTNDKIITVNDKNIIKIQTVNKIEVSKVNPIYEYLDKSFTSPSKYIRIMDRKNQDTQVHTSISYNNTYLVPRPISKYKHNNVLYDVYMVNDDGSDIIGDVRISDGKMITSGTRKEALDVTFNSRMKENITKEIDGTYARYVGFLSVEDYTYYDYDKKRVEIGLSSDLAKGDLIPYNFKGDYSRVISFKLNSDYDALRIYETKHINEPLLDMDEGSISLNINEVKYDPTIHMTKINKRTILRVHEGKGKIILRNIAFRSNE